MTGAVGSGIDVFLSTKKACQEYKVDDFNAAVATGISAVGSLVSTVGYVTAIWNPAIGVVLLAAGEVLMLVGTIAYAFCKNSELEAWLEHSLWGKSRNSAACGSTKWSRGPLSKYHHDLSKQIIAFDEIMFPVEAKWSADPTESIVFGQDDLCYLEVHCPVLSTDSVLTLGVSGETRPGVWEVVRPFGPVQVSQGGGEGRIVVRAAGYRRLVANCKIDIYGDRSHMLPHDTYKSAAISPTLAVRYEPPMLM